MNPIRKTAGHLGRTFVSLAVLAIGAVSGLVAHAAEGVAKVHALRGGDCQFSTNATAWEPLKVGMVLGPGTWVRTDSRATLDLLLKLNAPARLDPKTTLLIKNLTYTEGDRDKQDVTIVLVLTQGRMLGYVRRMSKDSVFRLETPAGAYLMPCLEGSGYQLSAAGRLVAFAGKLKVMFVPTGKSVAQEVVIPGQKVFDPTAREGRGAVVAMAPEERPPQIEIDVIPPPQPVDVPTRGEGLGVDPAKVGFNGPFPKAPAK